LIDRNLTPDKRKILLADNHYILKVIVHSLDRMFSRETMDVMSLSSSRLMNNFLTSTPLPGNPPPSMKRNTVECESESDSNPQGHVSKIFKRCHSPSDPSFELEAPTELEQSNIITENRSNVNNDPLTSNPIRSNDNSSTSKSPSSRMRFQRRIAPQPDKPVQGEVKHPFFNSFINFKPPPVVHCQTTAQSDGLNISNDVENAPPFTSHDNPDIEHDVSTTEIENADNVTSNTSNDCEVLEEIEPNELGSSPHNQSLPDDKECIASRESTIIDISIEDICEQYRNCFAETQIRLNDDNSSNFRAKIIPEDNENALTELRHTLTKQSFSEMRIVGQFNLGFIITKVCCIYFKI